MVITAQAYPRITDESNKEYGLLDASKLVEHKKKLPPDAMKGLIRKAIARANRKSSRESILISENATPEEVQKAYGKAGRNLFDYFRKYCDDPASTAHQLYGKHYSEVGTDQFRNRMLQKGRMNSGWRYQFLIFDCANLSERFNSVSDLGLTEADFNAVIEFTEPGREPLSLYVSVKNRVNTLGGQDWPKSIAALETIARNDRNRTGPYCCVFGIAMDRGYRNIKIEQKTKRPHSFNTEVWKSDFLWPFFANYSYEEVMTLVLDVLLKFQAADELPTQVDVPEEVLQTFGELCQRAGLLDENGRFDKPHKLVKFFCT